MMVYLKNQLVRCLSRLIITLFFLFLPANALAESEYQTVAINFLQYLHSAKTIVSLDLIEANTVAPSQAKIDSAYLARLSDGGYILISTSRQLTPIKAYSLQHNFASLPEPYRNYLLAEMEYNRRKADTVRTVLSDSPGETEKRWDFLLGFTTGRTISAYEPNDVLLTTQWNQGDPFNKFLPEISGEKVLAGCVNIALAQVMKYHGSPQTGAGVAVHDWNDQQLKTILYRDYNWSNMPDTITGLEPEYRIDEMALLIRDLGIANQTSFGVDSSGASINIDALVRNFGYSTAIATIDNYSPDGSSNLDAFFTTLKSEIDAEPEERPVLLSFPNHMVVADGYSSDDPLGRNIHINMGWGGSSDDFYYLENDVVASLTFDVHPPGGLTIHYNVKPCSGADCYVNLEAGDSLTDYSISGVFESNEDTDIYEVYLNGSTTITGDRGYENQAFYVAIFGSDHLLKAENDGENNAGITAPLAAGLYQVKVSLCSQASLCYDIDGDPPLADYTVDITTENLTNEEKAAIDASLDVAPEINNVFNDLVLAASSPGPYSILVDARDENNDPITLTVFSSDAAVVTAFLSDNILSLSPAPGAAPAAATITVTATANNQTTSKSFTVLVLDDGLTFGKEFTVRDIFESQPDINNHPVILDGACTIAGDNGYSNQAFFTWVLDDSNTIIAGPADYSINQTFPQATYTLRASLDSGGPYSYTTTNGHDAYSLAVNCPDADDSIETIAGLLGVTLPAPISLGTLISALQLLSGATPAEPLTAGLDINGDGRIGLAEAVYFFQVVAETRTP